jgi:uroporphyrinogen-III synthase
VANNAKHSQINLLLTRPKAGAEAFWDALDPFTQGIVTPVFSPLLKIIALEPAIENFGAAIFSSVNGVLHSPVGNAKKAYCVGVMTTKAAAKAGWDAIQVGETADQLVEALSEMEVSSSLTHFRGVHTRGNIALRLENAGHCAKSLAVYDQRNLLLNQQAVEAQDENFPLLVPLFSPRTARNFAQQSRGNAQLHLIALSHAVADEVTGFDMVSSTISTVPTRKAMIDAVQKVARYVALG